MAPVIQSWLGWTPSRKWSLLLSGLLVVIWGLLRMVIFPSFIFPLTFVLPLMICLWTRDKRALWAMAAIFAVMISVKLSLMPVHGSLGFDDWADYAATLADIVIGGAAIHLAINFRGRLERTLVDLRAANDELQVQSEELAQQNEELAQQSEELARQNEELQSQSEELESQNEELQSQSEELESQNEELQSQSEEIQSLNTELTGRESMLQKLLDATRLAHGEEAVLGDICAAAKELFGPGAATVVAWRLEQDRLIPWAQAGAGIDQPAPRPVESTFAGLVMHEGKTACLDDAALRPDLKLPRAAGEEPFQAALAAPMAVGDRPCGLVAAYSCRKQEWTAEQFRLIEWLAGQCGHILETLRLQEQLRVTAEQNERLAAIVESTDDAVISKDLHGIIQTWNAGAGRLFGYSAREALGKPIIMLLPCDRRSEEQEIMEQLRAGKRVDHRETVRVTKDGRRMDVLITASPLKDEAGRVIGASKIVRDITERKRAEESLRRTAEELARSNRDLEQFAYVASHDLQEPLRMVNAYMQLLAQRYRGKMDENADTYIGFAVDGAQRMSQLVQDLLAYSRISRAGKDLEDVPADEAVQSALGNLKMVLQESQAKVVCDKLPAVKADPTQLVQLFQNLLGNAIKFRRPHCRPEIHIGCERTNGRCEFFVKDNGIGIAPEHHERVFQIFQRLHTRDKYPGTGIGLAICKTIVERHGGRIWVQSNAGEGATFRFTLMPA